MREFIVETQSGFTREDGIIHYEDALEIAKQMTEEHEMPVNILMGNQLTMGKYNLIETINPSK